MSEDLVKLSQLSGELNFDDLDDSQFDENALSLSQSGRIGEEVSTPSDNSWRAFRTLKIDSERIKWEYPRTKKEREAGQIENSEVRGTHYIVGIRGIPIQWQYGFNFVTGEGADMKTVCRTTKMIEHLPGGVVREVSSDLPLEFPASQVYQSQREPDILTNVLRRRQDSLVLYGSRPPIGDSDGSPRLRTCQECVAALDYMEIPGDFKQSKGSCRMTGAMLFCVMQVATVEDDLINHTSTLKWQNVADWGFVTPQTPDGKTNVPLEGPFIVKIQGLTKIQHWDLGPGQYERQILEGPDTFIPKGVMSAGQYYDYVHDRQARGIRHTTHRASGMTVYPCVTEILTAGLVDTKYSKCMPVFYHQTDAEVIAGEQNWRALDWVKIALKTYQTERTAANMKNNVTLHAPGEYVAPAAVPSSALPPTPTEVATKPQPPKLSITPAGVNGDSIGEEDPKKFNAFKVPGKD